MRSPSDGPGPLRQRVLWFVAIYGGSVLGLGLVSLALRAWLKAG
jgi:hypothetical protein